MALPNVAEQDHHAVMKERSSSAMWKSMERGRKKAGIEGRQSATPKTIAVRMRFVNERMLNSTSSGADIGTHFAETTKLHFKSGMPKGGTMRAYAAVERATSVPKGRMLLLFSASTSLKAQSHSDPVLGCPDDADLT